MSEQRPGQQDRLAKLPIELKGNNLEELKALEAARKKVKSGNPQLRLNISEDNFHVNKLVEEARAANKENPIAFLLNKATTLDADPTLTTNKDNMYKWIELAIGALGGLKE